MHKLTRILAFVSVAGFAAEAHATATKNTENSATGVGMADAQVAIVDDPGAVYYNPAAMARLEDSALMLGVTPLILDGSFTADQNLPQGSPRTELRAGETVDQTLPVAPIPHLYGVARLPRANLAVGLGVFAPFATGSQFPEDWAGRAQGHHLQVLALAVNPNIAWAITPKLSVAAGFSLVQSSLEIEEALRPNFGNPAEDIGIHIAADGMGYQGNAAVHWQPTDMLALGVSYRTAIKVDMEGEIDFQTPNPVYAPAFPDQEIETTFRFPDTLNAGVGLFPADRWKIDAEVEFNRYNVNQELRIDLPLDRPSPEIVSANDWENTVSYRLGAEYKGSRLWDFRAGVAWDPTPIPIERMSPLDPDSDRFVTAIGASYHWKRNEFALGLQWQAFTNRTVGAEEIAAGAADLPGTYKSDLYVASLSWIYAFK